MHGLFIAVAACSAALPAQITVTPTTVLTHWDASAVRATAGELHTAAQAARAIASERLQARDPAQQRAMMDLAALDRAAALFFAAVERFPHGPEQTRWSYEAVLAAYSQARPTVDVPQFGSQVVQHFNRVGVLLTRLSAVYATAWDYTTVSAAAAELRSAAGDAYAVADAQRMPGIAVDTRGLFLLRRLRDSSDFLSERIELLRNPAATDADVRIVLRDYARVLDGIAAASFRQSLQQNLERMGAAAVRLQTAYGEPWDWATARVLAEEVRSAAAALLQVVSARTQPGGPDEKALRDLQQFSRAATELVARLDTGHGDATDTHPEFVTLAAAYDQAVFSLGAGRLETAAAEQLTRVGGLLGGLRRMYAGRPFHSTLPVPLQGIPVSSGASP